MNLSHQLLMLPPHGTWVFSPIKMVTPLPPSGMYPFLNLKPPQEWLLKSHPTQREGNVMPLHKALTGGPQAAFTRDSDLVQKAREEHYKANHPHFDHKNFTQPNEHFLGHDHICHLLGSKIHQIQEFWEGQSELRYANKLFKRLAKGTGIFPCHFSLRVTQSNGPNRHS